MPESTRRLGVAVIGYSFMGKAHSNAWRNVNAYYPDTPRIGQRVLVGRDDRNFTAAERYDTRRRRWERLPSLRTPRGGIAAARVGRRIVVFGGEELGGGTTIREVEVFDTRRRRWSSLPAMRSPRHGLGGVSLGRRVYAIEGGPNPGFAFSDAIEVLDVP